MGTEPESDRQSSDFGKVTDPIPVILGMTPPLTLEVGHGKHLHYLVVINRKIITTDSSEARMAGKLERSGLTEDL